MDLKYTSRLQEEHSDVNYSLINRLKRGYTGNTTEEPARGITPPTRRTMQSSLCQAQISNTGIQIDPCGLRKASRDYTARDSRNKGTKKAKLKNLKERHGLLQTAKDLVNE